MVLPVWAARCACGAMVVIFVGGLYLVPTEVRRLPRDDPRHIRARFVAVACATLASVVMARMMLGLLDTVPPWPSLVWIGLPSHGLLAATFLPLLLTAALFLGPLVTSAAYLRRWCAAAPIYTAGQWHWAERATPVAWGFAVRAELSSRAGPSPEEKLRALVVGPLCEEVVFRGCMLPLLLAAGAPPVRACLECPLVFGTPHPPAQFRPAQAPSAVCVLTACALRGGALAPRVRASGAGHPYMGEVIAHRDGAKRVHGVQLFRPHPHPHRARRCQQRASAPARISLLPCRAFSTSSGCSLASFCCARVTCGRASSRTRSAT